MIVPIFGSSTGGPSNSATNYTALNGGGGGYVTVETSVRETFPVAGTLEDFYISATVAPGVGKSFAFTIYINGSASTITASLIDANTIVSDLVNTVSISAGDRVSVQIVPSSTPASGPIRLGAKFTPTASGTSIILGGSTAVTSSAANRYNGLSGSGVRTWDATEANRSQLISVAGTISHLYASMAAAVDAGSITLTVYKNGSPTTLTVQFSGATVATSDTSNSFSVAAGDLLSMEAVPASTPGTKIIGWGVKIVPTVDGETPILFGDNQTPSASATNYTSLRGASGWSSGTGNRRFIDAVGTTFKNLYINVATAAGDAKSLAFTVRDDGSTTTLTHTITGAATTTGSDTSNSFTSAAGSEIDIQCVPTGTPTVSATKIAMTAFITPPSSSSSSSSSCRSSSSSSSSSSSISSSSSSSCRSSSSSSSYSSSSSSSNSSSSCSSSSSSSSCKSSSSSCSSSSCSSSSCSSSSCSSSCSSSSSCRSSSSSSSSNSSSSCSSSCSSSSSLSSYTRKTKITIRQVENLLGGRLHGRSISYQGKWSKGGR